MSGIMSGITSESSGKPFVSPFKKAIKDYQDELLTGLTEDEKAEIDAKMDAYRKKCVEAGMDAKAMQAALNDYYKSLLKEYGAKFDNAFEDAVNEAADGTSEAQSVGGTETGAVKSSEANTTKKTDMKTEMQTDPDGTVYLLITSPNGVSMKIKIGNDGDSKDDLLAGVQKTKQNTGVLDYEKNIDAFFEEKSSKTFVS